jgi:NAD(P)-dependent dehydrogenase (short-subunit alcohol dehydrogenase family)
MAAAQPERRIAFITGASYGIGYEIALGLARDGFDLALSGRRAANVAKTCRDVQALGGRAFPLALDVRSVESVRDSIAAVVKELGAIDVLVNNAGVPVNKLVLDTTPEEWENIIATNLSGTFYMSQALGRYLVDARRKGLIINMCSTHGIVGFANRAAYGISKAGVMHMTRMLAIEWAEHGIRVNAVAPGRVETESPGRVGPSTDPAYLELAKKRIPLGRFCPVGDVAEAVRYLASPAAGYITGHTLVLDGGVTVA